MSARIRQGMTLLEVVVALTVAGAALAAGAGVLGFLVDQQERAGAQQIASASVVRETMRDWILAARLTTEGDAEFRGARTAEGAMVPSDDGGDSDMSFVTGAPTRLSPAGGEAGTRVRIYMERGESAGIRGLVAELTPWRRPGAPVVVSLAPDATGFEARYLASLFGRRIWLKSWVSGSVLPAAVELRVRFDSTAKRPHDARAAQALLSLPITMALGARR